MNKYEKAIKYFQEHMKVLDNHCRHGGDFALEAREHTQTALEALKKQVPRALRGYEGILGNCPSCGVSLKSNVGYCNNCGQHIDQGLTDCVNFECEFCFRNRQKQVCPYYADKVDEIEAFFAGCDLSGFNSDRFDVPCIEEEFARVGVNFAAAARRHVDVQRIFHRMEPRDLTAAVKFYCDRPHTGAHGAEDDTVATLEVLKAQLSRYPSLPRDVASLDEWIAPHDPLNADRGGLFRWKEGQWTVNFGKKKGESLKRLMLNEPNFLKWMVKGDFDADARMIAADALEGRLPPPPQLQ